MRRSIYMDLIKLLAVFAAIWGFFVLIQKVSPEGFFSEFFPGSEAFELSIENEEKLGEIIVEQILDQSPGYEIKNNDQLDSAMFVITHRLLDSIGLTDYDYHIRVVDDKQVNAFTLPGGNIFINKGLIEFSDQPEEVAAVLAHEIGHVEHRHVVSKLIKEFGLAIIFSIITGGDAVLLTELSKTVVSSVFDRKQEREADRYALELMERSHINPKSMAAFFRKLNREGMSYDEKLEILMTHPHHNSRIKASLEYKLEEGFDDQSFDLDWDAVKASL